jgi:hypothetical protein
MRRSAGGLESLVGKVYSNHKRFALGYSSINEQKGKRRRLYLGLRPYQVEQNSFLRNWNTLYACSALASK